MKDIRILIENQADYHFFDLIKQLEEFTKKTDETKNHLYRVGVFSSLLSILLDFEPKRSEEIFLSSKLHDIGKIFIPKDIINKRGKFNTEEWAVMKTHSLKGYLLLQQFNDSIFKKASIVALEHHEKWNGSGYPYKKSKYDISLEARIVSIADVFDALFAKRCYKESWEPNEVYSYFEKEAGISFDPFITKILLDNFDTFLNIRKQSFRTYIEENKKEYSNLLFFV